MTGPSPADRWMLVQDLLAEALALAPSARESLLEERCGADPVLRAEVESLLEAADGAGRYFGDLADRAGMTLLTTGVAGDGADASGQPPPPAGAADFLGRQVGQYRILSWLGSGGSASVYLAEREGEGFTQRVALKLVPRRIADPLIRRRSHEERRILARLEHRSIARLIDGGLTPEGFSFYAMEYVDGSDLLTFCDEQRMRVKQRLELFLEVCAAVQFAHERLVIHCDLKPGNVFVTTEGHVKLLDFGVARMIDPDSAGDEATGFWFTPGYASPEQVLRQPPGTHSDVYALGVVLYEMLTGHRPYRFRTRDLEEVARVVCGQVPDLPSRVVLGPATWRRAGEEARFSPEAIATSRGSTPERLRKRLRGDLDAIVMKALAKSPEQRYRTVEQLAADVRRHLDHGLVSSVSATPRYRLAKLSRQHRRAIVSGALVAGTLVAGAAGTLWQAARASQATGVALQEAENAELFASLMLDIFRLSDPSQALGDTITARAILDRGAERILGELGGQPVIQSRLLSDVSVVYANLGLFTHAEPLLRRALEIRERTFGPESLEASESLAQLGILRADQGDVMGAIELLGRAVAVREPKVTHPDSTLIRAKAALAWQVRSAGDHERAAELFGAALEGERQLDPHGPRVAQVMLGLAATFHDSGSFDQADSLFRSVLADLDPTAGPSPAAVSALTNVGMIQRLRERFSEAERLLSAAADMAVALYGPDHVNVLTAEAEWGLALYGTGRWNEGEAMYRDAIPRAMSTLGPMHPTTSSLQEGLATILTGRGRFEEALELYRQGMEERRFRYGDIDHPAFVASLNRIAEPLIGLDRLDEARAVLRQAMEMNTRLGSDSGASVYTIIAEQSLGNIAWRQGRPAVAEEHFHTALALADELLRPDHRYTQSLKRDYGVFLGATGRIAEAVETLRWVLRTQERLLGVPHPQIEQTAAALRAATGAGGPETP